MKRISIHKALPFVSTIVFAIVFGISGSFALTPWTTLPTGTVENINSVYVLPSDSSIIYACGNNSILLRSTDSGSSWVILPSPNPGIKYTGIFFTDALTGYAVGESGTVIYTANAGSSWSVLSTGTTGDLNDLHFFSSSAGIIVGDNGLIRYTGDGGSTWQENSEGAFPESIYAIDSYDGTNAFICGENGIIRMSNDGGSTWTVKQTGNKFYGLNDISVSDKGAVLAVGDDGNIVFSSNFGASPFIPKISGTSENLYACDISPKGDVFYIGGDSGVFLRSMDAGSSFVTSVGGIGNEIKSIDFYSNSDGYISGSGGSIAMTGSGGSSQALYDLTVTSPTDGETFLFSDTLNIEWTSRNIDSVGIYFRVNDNDSWQLISEVADIGEYSTVFPGSASDSCKIRLVDIASNAPDAISTGYFNIFRPTMRLLSPNGDENWRNRANGNITWQGAQDDSVTIEYSTDKGKTWSTIEESCYAATESYTWQVPVTPTDEAMVRVYDKNNTENVDISDKVFSIHGVKLNTFQSGGEFLYGTEQTVSWDASGLSSLDIRYSVDSGVTWEEVVSGLPASDTSYIWTIPKTPSGICRLKLIDPENSQYFDVSSAVFTVTGVKLTSPAGGESMLSGTNETITWQSADIEKVSIKYSTNSGADWITVHSAVDAASGSYSWLIPKVESPGTVLAISDIDNPTVRDTSEKFFILNESGVVVTAPENGAVWNAGTTENITWASINVVSLDIEVSYDAGITWNLLASGVSANTGSYAWNIPSTVPSSTECQVRLTDSENPGVTAAIEGMFRIQNGLYQVPVNWSFVSQTGESAVIIVPDSLNPKIGNVDLQSGDVIGFFYKNPDTTTSGPYNNGGYRCAGRGVWQAGGGNLSITVWGDNSRTSEKDGYNMNEEYFVKVWDAAGGSEYDVYCEYSGNDYFTDNGISVITVFTSHQTQDIELPKNVWSLFSTNLRPIDPDIKDMMGGIAESVDYMKNEEGEIYDPTNGVNNINSLNSLHGYKIYMKEDATLEIKGVPALLNDNVIPLQAQKWHIISYLPQVSITPSHALTSLADSNLILLKNSKGEIYYPAYGINNLTACQSGGTDGNMNPGEGYIICVNTSDSIHYPRNGTSMPGDSTAPAIPNSDKSGTGKTALSLLGDYDSGFFKPISESTGSSSVMVVEGDFLNNGDEVAAVSESGFVYGASAVKNGRAILTVWGNNTRTQKIDGAAAGETLSLMYFNREKNSEQRLGIHSINSIITGEPITNELKYSENTPIKIEVSPGVLSVDSETNNMFEVSPNPAKDIVNIKFGEIKPERISIADVSGNIRIAYDAAKFGNGAYSLDVSGLPAGIYVLTVSDITGRYSRMISVVR